MDFKFKEVVEESIIYFYDQVLSSNEYTEDVFEELDHVYTQAPKADDYEVKNKELLEELQYIRKVNGDLVWQRDTDEEHEAKAKAFDEIFRLYIGYEDGWISFPRGSKSLSKEIINVCKSYESGEPNAKK